MKYFVIFNNILLITLPLQYCEIIKETIKIAKEVYTNYQLTSVIWCNREVDEISKFLQKYEGIVMTINLNISDDSILRDYKYQKDVLFSQTVFFANNPQEFEYFVKTVNPLTIISIRVIVVFLQPFKSVLINKITEVAWENDVGDVLIISETDEDESKLSTYLPYRNGMCGNHTAVTLESDTKQFFPAKFKNFYGCDIRVTALHYLPYVRLKILDNKLALGGLDGRVVTYVIQQLNATMNIVVKEDHGGLGGFMNNSAYGSFGDLVNNVADVMVPSLLIIKDRYNAAQYSYVTKFLDFLWCLPKRREIYQWAKALLPFYNTYTPLILLSFVVYLIYIKVIHRRQIVNSKNDSPSMTLFGLFFAQPLNFKSSLWILNIIYLTWIWFSFVVRIAYQGQLVKGLEHSLLETRLTTVEEALSVYKVFFGLHPIVEFYRNTSIEAKFKSISIDELATYVNMTGEGKKILVVIESLLLRLYPYEFEFLDEQVAKVPLSMFMRPRWPVSKAFNNMLQLITETGIIYKVMSASSYAYVLKRRKINRISFSPLKIESLGSIFYALILMWVISSLILCIEIILHRITKEPKKTIFYNIKLSSNLFKK